MGLDTLGGGTAGLMKRESLEVKNFLGSSSSVGIFPRTQLEPNQAPRMEVRFPVAGIQGGSTCPGGTGRFTFSFGAGTGSWMRGWALRMFKNFW